MRKLLQTTAFMMVSLSASATTFGPVENFDVVNDDPQGRSAHGFEIVLHGLRPSHITSLFGDARRWTGMERYGIPLVSETTDANGPVTVVTYKAAYNGSAWSAGTPSGTLKNAPADSCWPLGDPAYNLVTYPCDHFGVSTSLPATAVEYNWLLETGVPGQLTPQVSSVPAPVWTVTPVPPVNDVPQPPVVAVQVKAPKLEDNVEFGEPRWVKVTATGSPVNIEVGDLVQNNKVVKDAKKQVQIEWQLIQSDIRNPKSGVVDLTGVKLDSNVKAVVYTFESYEYTGDVDPETKEALPRTSDTPAQPDPADLGNFKAVQMAAINLDGVVPPPAPSPIAPSIDALLPSGVIGVPYNQEINVTPGNPGDVIAVTVTGLPASLSFDPLTKMISGTPDFVNLANPITIQADDLTNNTTTSITTTFDVYGVAIDFVPQPPAGTVGEPYSYKLSSTGGYGPITYSAAPLPAGLSLVNDVISGTPTTEGTTQVNYDASDAYGDQATGTPIDFVINPAAAITQACSGTNEQITFISPRPGAVAVNGWLSTAEGANRVAYPDFAHTTLAPGLNTFAIGHQISYSGTIDPSGVFCLADVMSVSLPLNVPAPNFSEGQVGTAYPVTAITPVGGWAPYTIAVSGLPAGLAFDGANVSGTPTVSGVFPVTLSVSDSKGNSFNITTASITVIMPLALPSPVLSKGQVGTAYPVTAITPTGGAAPYAVTVNGLPAGLTFDGATISGTPTVSGTFLLSLLATDSQGKSVNTTASLVVDPKLVASCTAPPGSKKASGNAAIKAVAGKTVTIGTKIVTLPDCVAITYKGQAKALVVGYAAEFKGYTINKLTYATSLIVDDGK